jgi:hypothetical protein
MADCVQGSRSKVKHGGSNVLHYCGIAAATLSHTLV